MKHRHAPAGPTLIALAICAAPLAPAAETDPLVPSSTPPYPADLLQQLRRAADVVPGAAPTAVRYAAVAETHRPLSLVLEDGSDETYVLARTAFQIVYPDGSVMVDAGMDRQVHEFFGDGQPYWQDRNDAVQQALRDASLVVITHEHGDHAAGVLRSSTRAEIAPHTLLTKAQVETLVLSPQMPELRLTPAMAEDYLVIDYRLLHPAAPGVVLLKAPGHTPGHQMVYARLADGTEYLFSGDVSWALDGILEARQRPPATSDRVGEDRDAIAHQLQWLDALAQDGDVVVVPSHDQAYLTRLEQRGLLTSGLATN